MPINNIFDPSEEGIGGATVLIFDQLGQMSTDLFGNSLGTKYDSSGTIIRMGSGVIKTCTQSDVDQGLNYCTRVGEAFIKNLAPGKYGIRVVPPGNPSSYIQTSTIEGTPGIDAWVKANEPPLFIEGFGTGFNHVFIGFVYPAELPWANNPPAAGTTVTGRNIFTHFSRPSHNQVFIPGPPVNECWIGLNDLASQQGLIALPCDQNSYFTIAVQNILKKGWMPNKHNNDSL